MKIRTDGCGGNLLVDRVEGQTVYVQQDISGTSEWWFHWRFRMEDIGAGETWQFVFTNGDVIGPMGPAVRTAREDWHFLSDFTCPGSTFAYTVPENVTWAEFAYSLPYDPEDFERFAQKWAALPFVRRDTLCQSKDGRDVPMLRIGHENAHGRMLLTARHHACETTGNYVMEGILSYLMEREAALTFPLLRRYEVCVIPFVDYDGVINGIQGKFQLPHDPYVDYTDKPIFPGVAAIQGLSRGVRDLFAVDCHSPARWNRQNDHVFIARPNVHTQTSLQVGSFLWTLSQRANPEDTLIYEMLYDKSITFDWRGNYLSDDEAAMLLQKSAPEFTEYFGWRGAHTLVFETPYFGVKDNRTSQTSMRNYGRLVGRAMELYINCL